jgi:ribosomal protein S15P/S13E
MARSPKAGFQGLSRLVKELRKCLKRNPKDRAARKASIQVVAKTKKKRDKMTKTRRKVQ